MNSLRFAAECFNPDKQTGLRMKKAVTFLFAAACLCFFSGCKEEKKASSGTSSGNPLTAPADYVGALGKAQKSAEKTLSAVGLDQAIKRFYTEQGRLPKDLDELVSKGAISQIPPAPRGMKYDYDSKTGVIKVVPE
jgi:hypothetical protein